MIKKNYKLKGTQKEFDAIRYQDCAITIEWELQALATLLQSVTETDGLDRYVISSIGCYLKTQLRRKKAVDHFFLNRNLGHEAEDEDVLLELHRINLKYGEQS